MAATTTARRRQQEFDGAASKFEVDQLQTRWAEEDAAAEQAKTIEARRIDDLSHRMRRLEAFVTAMPKATGEVIARHVRQALEEHAPLAYRGTWNPDEEYPRNSLTTFDGGMWLALAASTNGRRPKADPVWRLVVKTAPDGGFA